MSGVVGKKLRGSRVGLETMTEVVDESVLRKFTCLIFLHLVLFLRTPPKKLSPCFFIHTPKIRGPFSDS